MGVPGVLYVFAKKRPKINSLPWPTRKRIELRDAIHEPELREISRHGSSLRYLGSVRLGGRRTLATTTTAAPSAQQASEVSHRIH